MIQMNAYGLEMMEDDSAMAPEMPRGGIDPADEMLMTDPATAGKKGHAAIKKGQSKYGANNPRPLWLRRTEYLSNPDGKYVSFVLGMCSDIPQGVCWGQRC